MQLEDYFEFEKGDDWERIRVKGTRVAIEYLIEEFNSGATPEQIQDNYPTVSREEVYATITYYLHNQAEVDAYIVRCDAYEEQADQAYLQREPSDVVKRLRAMKAQ